MHAAPCAATDAFSVSPRLSSRLIQSSLNKKKPASSRLFSGSRQVVHGWCANAINGDSKLARSSVDNRSRGAVLHGLRGLRVLRDHLDNRHDANGHDKPAAAVHISAERRSTQVAAAHKPAQVEYIRGGAAHTPEPVAHTPERAARTPVAAAHTQAEAASTPDTLGSTRDMHSLHRARCLVTRCPPKTKYCL